MTSTNLKVKSSDEGNLVTVWASCSVEASHWVTVWVGHVVPPAIGLCGRDLKKTVAGGMVPGASRAGKRK